MYNPMEQFEVKKIFPWEIFGLNLSFTNATSMLMINMVVLVVVLSVLCLRVSIIPTRLQIIGESLYNLIDNMILGTAGPEAKKYMPFIFSLFIFILICNIMGMFPYAFTITSHIIVTFALAAVVFVGITSIGFIRHGLKYFSILLPSGTPMVMAPLMIFTEFFAYMVRPMSLSVRLAANMTAGHIVMKVIASFVIMAGVAGVVPFGLLIALTGFELFVAVLQAYIFSILTCVYLTDAIKLH